MAGDDDLKARLLAVRKAPPAFERVEVVERVELTPRMLRIRLQGDVLRRIAIDQPAMSVRFVVPWPGDELELPEWNGNEFLLADGRRPALRTFTPLRHDPSGTIEFEIVRHPGGAVSEWAEVATQGSAAGFSGPGAGYDFPADARRLLVLGDETALPAIGQLIEMAPESLALDLHVETVVPEARRDLPLRLGDDVTWHDTPPVATPGAELADWVEKLNGLPDDTHVWAAGEAAAVQRIRNHLFKTLGIERARGTVRGYWKPARR
ncbi:MAG: siderophore-interacting protein [Ilumatobacteraceae bacterium]